MKLFKLLLLILSFNFSVFCQNNNKENLKEIIINSSRITIPFSKSSKNIVVISASDIEKSTASNLTMLLQSLEGVDIVKRGVNGMQSDIKLRGGNFQQTLILVDGFKVEDPQTGHHTMNMMIPLENIERIEIVKGASARVFGQNAFSGAINIVTKKQGINSLVLNSVYGSNNYQKGGVFLSKKFDKTAVMSHFSQQKSDGYRENTDFINNNYIVKASINTHNEPIRFIATFNERKFGAQYFYTTPASSFNEYEETQSSLIGIHTKYIFKNLQFKPKIYWKRNQDVFLLKRYEPTFSRNHNISNKIGIAFNNSYQSSIGTLGFGLDFAKVSLASNNLGNQNRTIFNLFLEHRFSLADDKLSFTPGIAMSYFSDFGFATFPGLDVGYHVSEKFKMYWNIGTSYRVPTYTEMYINIPNFLKGNKDLSPEKAFSQDIGFKYQTNRISVNAAIFYRNASNLIDYVKESSTSLFYKAQNLRSINTKGFEFHTKVPFVFNNFIQNFNFGYTYLNEDYGRINVYESRYLLNNSIKHHFVTSLQSQFFKHFHQTIFYRYIEKPLNKYQVIDAKLTMDFNNIKIYGLVNNIFDEDYYEKLFVPMPKSNFELGLKYTF